MTATWNFPCKWGNQINKTLKRPYYFMLEVVFVSHRQVVGLLLCISVGWAPSPFELAFGDEFYPSPFIMVSKHPGLLCGGDVGFGPRPIWLARSAWGRVLEVVFVPHRQVVGLLLCISVGWAPSPFELAFGDEFYPSPFIRKKQDLYQIWIA